jgi:hypothetical protein
MFVCVIYSFFTRSQSMMRKFAMTAAFVVALAVAGYAQQKPDFSGTWTVDDSAATTTTTTTTTTTAPPAGGGGGRGMGGPLTVKQTATELSVERPGRGGGAPTTTVYKLDGSEFEVAGRGGAMMKATAKFDGAKLVITTKTDAGDVVQTWSLADGKLTIERTTPNGPMKTVYKKTT